MDLFGALLQRSSVRDFAPGEPSGEDLRRMLEAAQHAPSAGNGQPWRFLVLRHHGRRQALVQETMAHAAGDLERRGHPARVIADWRAAAAGLADRLLEAPRWILLFVDNRRYPGLTAQDGALAAQNLMLAAYGLGYGSSYQTTLFPEEAVLAHFGIPDCYSFICMLPIGRPGQLPGAQPRARAAPAVWEESYPGTGAPAAGAGKTGADIEGTPPGGEGVSTRASAGGARPVVEIVYSPACPVNAHFVAAAREWLRPFEVPGQIEVSEVRTDRSPDRTAGLLGIKNLSQLQHNVFIKVFVNGREVSSVPLDPADVSNGVCDALGLPSAARRGPAAWWGPVRHEDRPLPPGSPQCELLTKDNLDRSLELCLCRHPVGGLTPRCYHQPGRLIKLEWLERAWAEVPALGVIALDDNRPAGLIEAYPRRMAREAGFVTGRESPDEETLTVTCIEVAGGYPRLEVIDALMCRLAGAYSGGFGRYRWIEGLAIYGQTAGTNPYWVFEKYGFSHVQDLVPGKRALLRRRL